MTNSERSLLATLCYADIFDFPLREEELWRYLIGSKIRFSHFRKTLTILSSQNKIGQTRGYFFLPGRKILVPKRLKRIKSSQQKLELAQKVSLLLQNIPTIWFVGVSGAVAVQNAPKEDDIDLFIITAPYALWTTRLAATVLLDLKKLRRKPGDKTFTNKICLNMFMDARELRLPINERDLYGAHEVAQLKPLINKHHAYEAFIYANRWVASYLPHALKLTKAQLPHVFGNSAFDAVSKKIQLAYMKKRLTNEKVGDTLLRFHPRDAREWVMTTYSKNLYRIKHTSNP